VAACIPRPRRFRQASGELPLTCLHKLRINCARQLLETDLRPVQEISCADVPFFRTVFKRYTGLSPTVVCGVLFYPVAV